MNDRYKIIISNKNVYKEIQIDTEIESLSVGTNVNSDVRLRKELFFGTVQLYFRLSDGMWNVSCSDNVYFNLGDVRKLMNIPLYHGLEARLCYQESDNEALRMEFLLDFEYETQNYDRRISLTNVQRLKIGGTSDSQIYIQDKYLANGSIVLEKYSSSWNLNDLGCQYGVYVNGDRIIKNKILHNIDFFSTVGYSFYLRDNELYFSSSDNIQVMGMNVEAVDNQSTVLEYPKFNRNTRIQYSVCKDKIEVQQPTSKPNLTKKSIVLALIPTLVMLAMTIVLRGIMGGGGMFVIYSAVSMGMGAIMSVVTYIQDKKNYKQEIEEREESYKLYIKQKEEDIQQLRRRELGILQAIHVSLNESVDEALLFGKRIFEKSAEDKDFLQVYLGKGTVESENQVEFTKQEFVDLTDPISSLPEQLHNKYRFIENAPIISDFNASCGVGIVGHKPQLKEILKNVTLDVAIRHFYKEVKLAYLFCEDYVDEFRWVRWLQNVNNDALDLKNIAYDDESRNVLLEYLYAVLSERENALAENQTVKFDEQFVIFVTDASFIGTYPISKYIKDASKFGFTFVFFEEYEEKIPQGCTEIIRLRGDVEGFVLKSMAGDQSMAFCYPRISNQIAEMIALKLGAVYVDEVSLEGQLTKNITMFELLGIMSVEDLDLGARWNESEVYKTIAAPIGVKTGNEIVSLNISDKVGGHGPHGLVAGTTGSGKSEILQTYILSIATLFHPYDVGFVIIDFKGGGMANQFANLPHLIGTITNIDGREINRSLLSIKAELVKRQEMFSEAGVNHINDYIKLFKKGVVSKPMPHLIMIVDEFAELKAEYPDFMKELISAARIGRTLGVHLILATQKPAGVVDAQIWSNSKFKLCLKVQTKEDSNEVLKTPLAAEIVEPGRAYFQVGNNEIFELIQSAYSGANVPEGNDINEKVFSIYERNLWGRKSLIYTNKRSKKSSESETQLDAIVDFVNLYCRANDIDRLPGICLPAMPTVIRTDSLDYSVSQEGFVVPVGMYDDPEQQKQGSVYMDVSRDNVYIVGSAQMGKTIMLQTMVYGLIRMYSPEQVNLYLVDCGSMVLKIFEKSAHVGGVVLSNEEEKCKNLFKMLNSTIIERKKILSGKGVGNFASYLEAGYKDLPLMVVAIDNIAAFKEYFADQFEQLNSLSREAQGVGISFVITAATANALNYRVQANFNKKFVLNCNDAGEYSTVFGHCKETPGENQGRGLFVMDKRILEMQIAIFGKSNKEAERSEELRAFIQKENSRYTKKAAPIPMVPGKLELSEIMVENPQLFRNKQVIPLGMEFATVEYTYVDMMQSGSLALVGDAECRIMFARNFLNILNRNIIFHNVEAYVIDDKQRSLAQSESYGFVKSYTNNSAEGMLYLSEFYDRINDIEEDEFNDDASAKLLVINNSEVMKQILADKNASKELALTIKNLNDKNAFVLFVGIDNLPVGFNSSDLLKAIKEERQGILFAPIADNKLYEISGRAKADSNFDKSMGYRFGNGAYTKIKLFE